VECDGASSVILEVEAGRGIALVSTILKRVFVSNSHKHCYFGRTELNETRMQLISSRGLDEDFEPISSRRI
jgi:hypothetical protein